MRFIDLTGDGLADKLISHGSSLSVSISNGTGTFDSVPQQLPSAEFVDVLVSDLDGDDLLDVYLISKGQNVALRGDGTGRFTDATQALGLADKGHGLSAELIAVDHDGTDELLLHNVDGDVLFWFTGRGFQRDASTPALENSGLQDASLQDLQQLVAGAAELLALDPDEELVLSIDDNGRPQISLGRRASRVEGAFDATEIPNLGNERLAASGPVDSASSTATTTTPGRFIAGNPPPATTALTTQEQEILDAMSIVMLDDGAGNLVNKTIRMTGVNFQVVNGLGATNGNPNNPGSTSNSNTVVNGVGNLIVGYNELGNPLADDRTGSHNVVLGMANSYPRFGGLVGARENTISGPFTTVSGGRRNQAKAPFSSVTGGKSNTTKGSYASVAGGWFNIASGPRSVVSGGQGNKASGGQSSVSGGFSNSARELRTSVSGGAFNEASETHASVSGGKYNTAEGHWSSISGGLYNYAENDGASISGGIYGTSTGWASSVSGGAYNTADGNFSSVSGGAGNTASGHYSSISGGYANIVAYGSYSSSVSGGYRNTASGYDSTISGGVSNSASGYASSVSGGWENEASGYYSSVTGGWNNEAGGYLSSISGGRENEASGYYSSVSGGRENTASGYDSSVSGGRNNTASGINSSVSGGNNRSVAATHNWAAGALFQNN